MKKTIIFIAICLAIGCSKAKSKHNTETSEVAQSAAAAHAVAQERVMEAPPPPPSSKTERTDAVVATHNSMAAFPDSISSVKTPLDAAPIKHTIIPSSTYSTPIRKIVRTAQVKSKVENTEQATYKIEQIARKFNGFVTQTHLESRNLQTSETPISKDSTLEITQFEVGNTIALRVPNQHLDTFLSELSRIYTHLDYRRINAQDLTATFLTNQLKAQLRENSAQRIAQASDEKGKRLNEITDAEETRVTMKDAAIEQQIHNLETDYDIAFSVVNIEIYQNAVVSKTMKTNVSSLNTSANFGFRLTNALANGWSILLEILLFFVNLWAFILLGLGVYIVYRKVKRNAIPFLTSK
jgi:hypothetical protein